MSRSRRYVLRRQRSWRGWVKPGRQDLRWQVDGEREYRDTVDPYVTSLDYSWAWKHELEARQRNHRTRGARRRDKERRWNYRYPCGCVLMCDRKLKGCKFYGMECRRPHTLG